MPGMHPDLTVGSADEKLAAELIQRFLIILGQLAKPFQPPVLDAAKWTFRPVQVWFDRSGHLELAYPGGTFRMFIHASQSERFIEELRKAGPGVRVLVHVAEEWRGAAWRRIGIIDDDVLMLAHCVELDREGFLAVLTPEERRSVIEQYDARKADPPPTDGPQAPAE